MNPIHLPATERAGRYARRVLPAIVVLAAFAILIALGSWQFQRRTWKENLIAALADRAARAPVPLPSRAEWGRLNTGDDEFRRIFFEAEFQHQREALVYTTGSALRSTSGPGYWVFTPARLSDDAVVIVNRGFVPEGRQHPAARPEGQLTGRVVIQGALRFSETRSWFGPADDPARNLFFARDPQAIGAAKGIAEVAPFYIEQEAPPPPGGLPQVARLSPTLPNNHLQYALTWFGLAVTLAAVLAGWVWSERSQNPT